MNSIIRRYKKILGYMMSEREVITLYQQGELILNDKEENAILKLIN